MAVESVEFNLDHMLGKIDRLQFLEVPFAASVAVNRVAALAKDAIRDQMARGPHRFRNPVPFTLNSMYMKASNKLNLEAEIGVRDFAPRATQLASTWHRRSKVARLTPHGFRSRCDIAGSLLQIVLLYRRSQIYCGPICTAMLVLGCTRRFFIS